jgi:hypothetical protein
MKPLQKLSAEDLLRKKVWKYISEDGNDDTAKVEPAELNELSESLNDVFVALTYFTVADGTIYTGYSSPTDSSGIDYIQPVIIFEGRHLPLWNGDSEQISNILKKRISDIFPIEYECQVPVDGKTLKSKVNLNEINNA